MSDHNLAGCHLLEDRLHDLGIEVLTAMPVNEKSDLGLAEFLVQFKSMNLNIILAISPTHCTVLLR